MYIEQKYFRLRSRQSFKLGPTHPKFKLKIQSGIYTNKYLYIFKYFTNTYTQIFLLKNLYW